MPPTSLEEFTEKLVAIGEEEVRSNLLKRVWNSPRKEWAEDWLVFEEKKRSAASATRAEARDEETLAIAKEANRIARSASRWAMWAAIIAVMAAAIATKDQILALIFTHP